MASAHHTAQYRRAKIDFVGLPCWMCGNPSDSVDHVPPISSFRPGEWRGELRPACTPCQTKQGGNIRAAIARDRRPPLPSRAW